MVPVQILAAPDTDLLVVADYTGQSLRLLDKNGDELSSTGGLGRGPGEFQGINQLYISYNQLLYVVDIQLRRLTVFEIQVEQLAYQTTISLNYASNMHLQRIYVTETGTFGVFNKLDDYQTWENRFHLYRLDESFHPEEHILEMPGNEKIEIISRLFIDNPLGSLTFWDIDGEWFYYIRSNSNEIHKFHLTTGDREIVQYLNFEERVNTSHNIAFLKENMQGLIERYPVVGEAIEKSQTLPLFRDLLVQDDQMLLSIYHAGGDYGAILHIDQESEEVSYIKTPPYFRHLSLRNHIVYGIDSTPPDERRIMYVKLNYD